MQRTRRPVNCLNLSPFAQQNVVLAVISSHEINLNYMYCSIYEPAHEIMVLFVLHKLILEMRMHSHPVGLDVWFFVEPFLYFHTSCVWTAKTLARLRGCAGSLELAGCLCDEYHNLMSWLKWSPTHSFYAHSVLLHAWRIFSTLYLVYFLSIFPNESWPSWPKKKILLQNLKINTVRWISS